MLNIIDGYLKHNGSEFLSITLINVNSSTSSVFATEILENYVTSSMGKFKYTNLISGTEDSDLGNIRRGRVSAEILKELMPPPNRTTCIVICGPPTFNEVCRDFAEELSYRRDSVKVL